MAVEQAAALAVSVAAGGDVIAQTIVGQWRCEYSSRRTFGPNAPPQTDGGTFVMVVNADGTVFAQGVQ